MLVLKESGINAISKEYLDSLRKLEEGETVYFQLLTGIPNNDPDLTERAKRPINYGHVQIPAMDTIKDPFSKQTVRIGVVEDYDVRTGEVSKYKCYVPNQHLPQNPGIFSLRGGNLDDEELFEYLQITNYNRDVPNRDGKKEALFYEIKKNENTHKPVIVTPIQLKKHTVKEKDLAEV